VLSLVLFDETCACREDGWKREEEATNLRTEASGDDTGGDGAEASEEESQGEFVEFDSFERCEFCGDDHVDSIGGYLRKTIHKANDVPNQTGKRATLAASAGGLYRMRIQLTAAAYKKKARAPAIMERASRAAKVLTTAPPNDEPNEDLFYAHSFIPKAALMRPFGPA
jgi:hypothetical protein